MSPEPEPAPGALVLVVGPSGAGKDTIMRGARARLGDASGASFPRRIVTRPADGFEDNDTATPESFADAVRCGAFVLDWQAHGLRYGIPRQVCDQLARGEVVVVNVSRTAVARAREAFGVVRVVLVTAPPAVLEARILTRGRDGDAPERLARDLISRDALKPDLVIENAGSLDAAVELLLAFLRSELACRPSPGFQERSSRA